MTRQDAVEVLAIVAATWRGSPTVDSPEIAVAVWADALNDIPRELVERALKIHIKRGRFAPAPADIRDIVREISAVGPINRGAAIDVVLDPGYLEMGGKA